MNTFKEKSQRSAKRCVYLICLNVLSISVAEAKITTRDRVITYSKENYEIDLKEGEYELVCYSNSLTSGCIVEWTGLNDYSRLPSNASRTNNTTFSGRRLGPYALGGDGLYNTSIKRDATKAKLEIHHFKSIVYAPNAAKKDKCLIQDEQVATLLIKDDEFINRRYGKLKERPIDQCDFSIVVEEGKVATFKKPYDTTLYPPYPIGLFLSIKNNSNTADKLKAVEIEGVKNIGFYMGSENAFDLTGEGYPNSDQTKDFTIEPHSTLEMSLDGLHIRFFEPNRKHWKKKEQISVYEDFENVLLRPASVAVPVTLEFEKAGKISLEVDWVVK